MQQEEAISLPEVEGQAQTSIMPMHLEEQARDLSATVFFGVKSLLQRSYHEAEENLAAYQAMTNAEIAHTEMLLLTLEEKHAALSQENALLRESLSHAQENELSLQQTIQTERQDKLKALEEKFACQAQIEYQKSDILNLQDTISRLNQQHKTLKESHESDMAKMHQQHLEKTDEIQAFFEKSMQQAKDNYLKNLEHEKRIHLEALQSKEKERQQYAQQAREIQESLNTRLQQAKTHHLENLEHEKRMHAEVLRQKEMEYQHHIAQANEKQESFKRSMQQVQEHHLKEMQHERNQLAICQQQLEEQKTIQKQLIEKLKTEKQAYQLDKDMIRREAEATIKKMEHLLTLEKENEKNNHLKTKQDLEKTIEDIKSAACHRIKALKTQISTHSAEPQEKNTLALQCKSLQKELSVMAQKKLTIEMHVKHLQKEIITLKKIISDLRKKQLNYTVMI